MESVLLGKPTHETSRKYGAYLPENRQESRVVSAAQFGITSNP